MPITPIKNRLPGAAVVGTGDFLGTGIRNQATSAPAVPEAPTTSDVTTGISPVATPMVATSNPALSTTGQALADKNKANLDAFNTSMGIKGNASIGGVTTPPVVTTPTATEQANQGLVSPTTAEGAYGAGATAKEQSAQAKAIGTSYGTDAQGIRTASDLLIEKNNLANSQENQDKSRALQFKQSVLQQEDRTRATLGQINAMRMRMGSGTSSNFDSQLQQSYDMQKGIVGYLSEMNDIQSQDALRAYDYSMNKLDNGYNDTIQKISNMAASRIKDAKASGKLSTMADISTFRNELASTFDEIAKTSLVFAEEKSRVSEYYKTVGDKLLAQNKLDNEVDEVASQQLGYLVNKNGRQYGATKTPYVDYALKKAMILQDSQNEFNANQADLDRQIKLQQSGGILPTGSAGSVEYGSGTTDFTPLASRYPNVAAFKNNNPAGIKWNGNFDKGIGTSALLDKAGISYEKGTATPPGETGPYVKFNSIEDGLAAQRIIMAGTYANSTVGNMLSSWVGTSEGQAYAKQVAGNAGINLNAKVNTLTPAELDLLQISKLQKESPGLYKELTNAGLIEGNTINFAKPPVFDAQDIASGNAPDVALDFADSLNKGTFTVSSPNGSNASTYTPAQVTAFDAFAKSNDTKDLRGLTLGDFNAYTQSNQLSPDDQFKIQQALSAVPAQLRNSDTESKNYINLAKIGIKQGLNPQQIADKFTGFTITNKAVQSFADKLRNTYNALENAKTDDIKTIAQLVNAKDYDGATRKVENTAYTSLGGDKQNMENTVAKYVRAADRITEFVKANPNSIGPIQGYISGATRNWTGDPKVAQALADLSALNSQLVSQSVKGVPSDVDTAMLSQAFSTLTSSEANILGVLGQTKTEMINTLNADRSRLGLPELTDKDVGNYKNRASLYFVEK